MPASGNPGVGLDAFDAAARHEVLRGLVRSRATPPVAGGNVNMHFHSFYSYNAEGWSPSRISWEASRRGLYAAGLCDFDVLDGLEELLDAGLLTGLRSAVYLETRAFVRALRGAEISSPGEPGVAYVMGAGFARLPEARSPEAGTLEALRRTARERNLALVRRMAAAVPDVALDYEAHVLPLTPAGVATERHIIRAFVERALTLASPGVFLASLLGKETSAVAKLLGDRAALEEAVRARVVKRGGLAYLQPDERTFPPLADFFAWVGRCGAIPMAAWLDGTSAGEAGADAFLDVMAEAGSCALNVIPERNWNIADPDVRGRKVAKLRAVVAAAARRHLPIYIGTEMNRAGLPFVDDLDGPVLREHRAAFLEGARVMVGHTVLLRYAGLSYGGARARAEIGESVEARNALFASVGALPPLGEAVARRLDDAGQERALGTILRSARAGQWVD
jgi:hypothetical protein